MFFASVEQLSSIAATEDFLKGSVKHRYNSISIGVVE
jgi:hypothetical protein